MVTYSAGEAIGPAWEHTRTLLFRDRRWPRILKVCVVAFVSQLGGGLNGNLNRGSGNAHIPAAVRSMLLAVGVFFGLISFVVSTVLIYVGSRLQFVLFDIVLLRDDSVAPAWRRHGAHTWRWIGVKLVFAMCLGVVLSPLLIPGILGLIHLFQSGALAVGADKHLSRLRCWRSGCSWLLRSCLPLRCSLSACTGVFVVLDVAWCWRWKICRLARPFGVPGSSFRGQARSAVRWCAVC